MSGGLIKDSFRPVVLRMYYIMLRNIRTQQSTESSYNQPTSEYFSCSHSTVTNYIRCTNEQCVVPLFIITTFPGNITALYSTALCKTTITTEARHSLQLYNLVSGGPAKRRWRAGYSSERRGRMNN